MSISSLFYIIGGQYLISKLMQLVPISGYEHGYGAIKFLILPVIISVIYGIGSGSRWYRTLFLEEIEKDYVKTAKSKGLSEIKVLFIHVFKNALIPILTGVVVILPLLFMGSLIVEVFFWNTRLRKLHNRCYTKSGFCNSKSNGFSWNCFIYIRLNFN